MRLFKWVKIISYGAFLSMATMAATQAQDTGQRHGDAMAFRFLGPALGNRVASFAGIPGDTMTYYAGASSGGIWKSSDGGSNWKPIFDQQRAAAIGALAVAPSNPNVVWAGTGEPWAIRDVDITGNGVYKSTDAGETWTHMGLAETGRVARIIIDPANPQTVFVCAEGRLTGPQEERGVFVTRNGGTTWTRSLFVDTKTGCSGLAMDTRDHNTLFAGTWQVVMHTWGFFSGGPGSGVYVTHDGGVTWQRLEGHGLPKSPVGKIDVAVAPTNSNRVYALIETKHQGSVWRSDDGGKNWQTISWDRALIGRAGYYIRIAVSPGDENKLYIANSAFHVSTDGGKTWPAKPWGGDTHDIWMDPKDPDHFAFTSDGGFAITRNGGKSFNNVVLPVGQMYHVAVDDQIPYFIYTNMQDDGTMRGPSVPEPPARLKPTNADWTFGMGGCESGFTLPDLANPNVVWSTCYAAEVTRWVAGNLTRKARSVSPWFHTLDSAPQQAKYRCHWTPPLAIDPFDHNNVYFGCQVVFKTSDKGQSWSVISPDLSTNDPKYLVSSGGLIGDNLGQFYGEVVFALALSTVQKGLLWAGTNDGKVWYTSDGGDHWNDVTKNVGMKPWGTITSIQPSFFKVGTAYISVDYHLGWKGDDADRDPYIFKTTDFGKSWSPISSNLPKSELSYVRNVSEDPNSEGLLFAGTGDALYYSLDDGAQWTGLSTGLPHSPVTWTVVQKRFRDLVISTWGRGIYILDDITPLEQMAKHPTTEAVRLFNPRPSYRLTRSAHAYAPNAYINFALAASPQQDVQIQIANSAGKIIRTMHASAHEGLNRVKWDMLYDDLTPVVLRTIPPEDPHIWEGARFKGKDFRPVLHWGMPPVVPGPLAVPGTYQVRLTVDGTTRTAPLEILRDPNSKADLAGMQATLKLQLRIADDVHKVASMVNLSEQMRAQLENLESKYADDPQMLKAVRGMDKQIQEVEYELFSRYLGASDGKIYESQWKVYYNLLWLNGEIGGGAGDVAGGEDFGPTDVQPKLLALLEQDLDKGTARYQALMAKIPAFNQMLQQKGASPIDVEPKPVPDLKRFKWR